MEKLKNGMWENGKMEEWNVGKWKGGKMESRGNGEVWVRFFMIIPF